MMPLDYSRNRRATTFREVAPIIEATNPFDAISQIFSFMLRSAGYSIGFVGFTSSTPGKMAMGMWMSDGNGRRVLPDRAILRYLVIALPNLVLVGVLRDEVRLSVIAWLAVTAAILLLDAVFLLRADDNRLLHDRIAGTRVISGRPPPLDG